MPRNSYFLYITLFFSFAVAHFAHPLKISHTKIKIDPLTINEQLLKIVDAGNHRFFSGVYWVLTLLQSDNIHYKGNDKSWMFYRLNLISTLDPRFYENYRYGGLYLSVIKDDTVGAKIIYDRGIKEFPSDFWLNYQGGFNDYFELGLNKDALIKFKKIIGHPLVNNQFRFIPSIVAKLQADEGDLKDAYTLLKANHKSMRHPFFRDHFKDLLYSLRATIDLNCLNVEKRKDCHLTDEDGDYYIKGKDGLYLSKKPLKDLKIKKAHRKTGL